MTKKTVFSFLLFSLSVLGANAAKVEKTCTIKVNGESRSYLLYVPDKAEANAPLVFSLHGTGGHSTDKSPFRTSVADSKGCIVVYPQGESIYFPVFGGYQPGWHAVGTTSGDIDFFKAIIEDVNKNYTIDRKRIYCCGFSNGGMMTYTVANVANDTFAAFCSISGYPINEFHLHHTGRPVPFLHIHGKADDFVKYSLMPSIVDNMIAHNGANPVAKKTTSSGKYTKSVFAETEGGFPYIYYEVDGMGHNDYTSNTEDSNSALTMWKFMSQYTLDTPCDQTLRWKPNLEAKGYVAKQHGWTLNKSNTALLFGDQQFTDANQNVYRSLQFETGKYKLAFHSECAAPQTLTVTLTKLTEPYTEVINKEVESGTDATIFFDVADGWGEYKLLIKRSSTDASVTFSNMSISTSTEEEASAIPAAPSSVSAAEMGYYSLTGVKYSAPQPGVNIVKMSDGTSKKVLRK